jgi:hypothetical protein
MADAGLLCFVGSIWEGELRLTAKTRAFTDKPILKQKLGEELDNRKKGPNAATKPTPLDGFDGGDKVFVLGGIAARDGVLVCALVRQNELLVVDAAQGKITSHITLANPRGLAFDDKGRLLALSGRQLLRFAQLAAKPETIITKGLEDPRHVTTDAKGRFLITDRGASHQVKLFSVAGKLTGTIGKPGAPSVGRYEPLHLNNPNGLAVDSQGRIWVAEADNYPRRVSVWSDNGKLVRAFYGPTEYGGGGVLDPQDSTRLLQGPGIQTRLDHWHGHTHAHLCKA